jgi:hypothetical protein
VQSSNGSKAANITIEITDDSTASPINVITEGTFDLQATVPSSQIELVGVGTVHNTQIDGVNSNNLVMPAGLQTDDVIFVVIFTATATDDYATPTGWNEISYDPTNLSVQCFTRVYGKATGSDDFAMDGTYTSNRNRVYVPFAFRDNSGTQSATETLGTQQGNTGVNAGTDGVASWGFFGMTAGTPLTEEHLILSVNHRSDISSPPTSGFSVNDHEISELQTVAKGGDYYASPADHAQWWLISWMRQSTGAEIGTPAVEDDLVYAPTSTFAWEFSKLFRLQYGSDPS